MIGKMNNLYTPKQHFIMQRLERTERMMVSWMCGVSLKDRISSVELNW